MLTSYLGISKASPSPQSADGQCQCLDIKLNIRLPSLLFIVLISILKLSKYVALFPYCYSVEALFSYCYSILLNIVATAPRLVPKVSPKTAKLFGGGMKARWSADNIHSNGTQSAPSSPSSPRQPVKSILKKVNAPRSALAQGDVITADIDKSGTLSVEKLTMESEDITDYTA
jgi:hypothetical protein